MTHPVILAFDLSYNKTGWATLVNGKIHETGVVSSLIYRRGSKVVDSVRAERSVGVTNDFVSMIQCFDCPLFVAYENPQNFLTAKMRRGRGGGRGTNIRTAMSFGAAQERLFYAVGMAHKSGVDIVSVMSITPNSWQSYIRKRCPKLEPAWTEKLRAEYEEANMFSQKRRTKLEMRLDIALMFQDEYWTIGQAKVESPFLRGRIYRNAWKFDMTDDEVDAVGVALKAKHDVDCGAYHLYE